jgi:hypothetical protein
MWGRFPLTKVAIRVLEIAGAGLTSAVVAYLLGRTEPAPPVPPPVVVHLAPSDQEMIRTVHGDQTALLEQLRSEADARKKIQGTSQVASQATPPVAAAESVPPQAAPQTAVSQLTTPDATTSQATAAQAAAPQQAAPQQMTPQPGLTTDVAVSASDIAAASAPVAQPDKSLQTSARREQKPERARVVDTKHEASKSELKPESKPRAKAAARADEPQARPMPGVVVEAVARNAAQREREAVAAPVLAAPPPPPPPVASAPPPESDGVLSSTLRGITAWILPSRDRVPMPDQNATRPPKAVGEFQSSM